MSTRYGPWNQLRLVRHLITTDTQKIFRTHFLHLLNFSQVGSYIEHVEEHQEAPIPPQPEGIAVAAPPPIAPIMTPALQRTIAKLLAAIRVVPKAPTQALYMVA